MHGTKMRSCHCILEKAADMQLKHSYGQGLCFLLSANGMLRLTPEINSHSFAQLWTALGLMMTCTQAPFVSWFPNSTGKHAWPRIVLELIRSACCPLHHPEQQFVATPCRNAVEAGPDPTFIGFYRLKGSKNNAFEIIHSRAECDRPLEHSSAQTVSLSA